MATILEGLNAISQAVGGTGEAESNLEALNAISGALGGAADAENNADAIANIAENASGGGGGGTGSLKYGEVTINVESNFPVPYVHVQTIIDGAFSYAKIESGSSGKMIVPLDIYDGETTMKGTSSLNAGYQPKMTASATGGTAKILNTGTGMAVLYVASEPNNTNMTVTLSKAS